MTSDVECGYFSAILIFFLLLNFISFEYFMKLNIDKWQICFIKQLCPSPVYRGEDQPAVSSSDTCHSQTPPRTSSSSSPHHPRPAPGRNPGQLQHPCREKDINGQISPGQTGPVEVRYSDVADVSSLMSQRHNSRFFQGLSLSKHIQSGHIKRNEEKTL